MKEKVEYLAVPSILSTGIERQKKATSCACKVCGAPARYSYFGAITCHSCKMFFKRNAENGQAALKCHSGGSCEINIHNRHTCASCRLAKCFAVGMRSEMIRSSRCRKNKSSVKRKSTTNPAASTSSTAAAITKPVTIATLNLLESDRSSLSVNQWNLLSNLVHCYNEYCGYGCVENFLHEQSQLPLKLRFKSSSINDLVILLKGNLERVFVNNRDFLVLSQSDRTTLVRVAARYATTVGGIFIFSQFRLLDSVPLYQSSEVIFSPPAVKMAKRLHDQIDPDSTFMKVILSLLAFSTINYAVYRKESGTYFTDAKAIVAIQDTYTDLAWRYLSYKYGHYQAVLRFSNLIRCLFSAIETIVNAQESSRFLELVETVIRQTEQTFIV